MNQHSPDGPPDDAPQAPAAGGADTAFSLSLLTRRLESASRAIDEIYNDLEASQSIRFARSILTLGAAFDTLTSAIDDGLTPPNDLILGCHEILNRIQDALDSAAQSVGPMELVQRTADLDALIMSSDIEITPIVTYLVDVGLDRPHPLQRIHHLSTQAVMHLLYTKAQAITSTLDETRKLRSKVHRALERDSARAEAVQSTMQTYSDRRDAESAEREARYTAELARLSSEAKARIDGATQALKTAAGTADHASAESAQRRSATRWTLLSITFAVLLAASWVFVAEDLSALSATQQIALRSVFVVVFAGLAAFSARQANEYRREERWTRDKRLELAIVDQYRQLPRDERPEFKEFIQWLLASPRYDRGDVKGPARAPVDTTRLLPGGFADWRERKNEGPDGRLGDRDRRAAPGHDS